MKTAPADPVEAARQAGFDLNLIELNLSLTPKERWRQHDMALEVLIELENAHPARDATIHDAPTQAG